MRRCLAGLDTCEDSASPAQSRWRFADPFDGAESLLPCGSLVCAADRWGRDGSTLTRGCAGSAFAVIGGLEGTTTLTTARGGILRFGAANSGPSMSSMSSSSSSSSLSLARMIFAEGLTGRGRGFGFLVLLPAFVSSIDEQILGLHYRRECCFTHQ